MSRADGGGTRRRAHGPVGTGVKRLARTALAVGIIGLLVVAGLTSGRVVEDARAAVVVTNTSTTFSVNATGTYSFDPDEIQGLPANVSLNVSFANLDASGQTHTFTILGCEGIAIASPSTAVASDYINGSKCDKAPLVNVGSSSSTPAVVSFPAPATGWYEFVCSEPGHLAKGMYGYIAFGMALPSNLTVTTPDTAAGLAVFIIVGTIVSLTVIAIVLGFVVGRREGGRHEMPPERLGYPEPTAPAPLPSAPASTHPPERPPSAPPG